MKTLDHFRSIGSTPMEDLVPDSSSSISVQSQPRSRRHRPLGLRHWLIALLVAGLASCSGEDPRERTQRMIDEGETRAALQLLREEVENDPGNALLNYLYGSLLSQAGQPSLAVWSLSKAARDPEYAVEAGLALANAQMRSNSAADAVRSASRVLEVDENNSAAIRLQIAALLAEKREEEALDALQALEFLEPDNIELPMVRFQALLGLEKGEAARDTLIEIRQRLDELENPEARIAAQYCAIESMFAHEQGRSGEARERLQECLPLYAENPLFVQASTQLYDELGDAQASLDVLGAAIAARPSEMAWRVSLADRLRQLGRVEDAESELRTAIELDPTGPGPWSALSDFQVETGDLRGGLESLEKAIELIPEPPPYWHLARVDLLIRLHEFDRAAPEIDEIEQPVYRHIARGRFLLEQGDPASATVELDAGIRLWPDNPMARFLAAQAAEQLGDFERAESQYRESVRSDAAHTSAGLELGILLMSRGRLEEALHALRLHREAHPHDPALYPVILDLARRTDRQQLWRKTLLEMSQAPGLGAEAIALGAEMASEANGPAAAIHVVRASKLDLQDPRNLPALSKLATALNENGRGTEAIQAIDLAIERSPQSPDLLALRGSVLLAAGKSNEARNAYEQAVAIAPDHRDALVGVGRLEEASGDLEAALSAYQRAASSGPIGTGADAGLLAARVERRLGRSDAAEARLEALLLADPRHSGVAGLLAELLLERKADPDRALELAGRAARFVPPTVAAQEEWSTAQIRLGRASLVHSEDSAALAAFERARTAWPTPTADYWIGVAYERLGRDQDAEGAFVTALAGESFPEQDDARVRLGRLRATGS